MFRVIVSSNNVSEITRKAISRFTGNNTLLTKDEIEEIEDAIIDAPALDADYEYKRGIVLAARELADMIHRGYYEPQYLTSWSLDEGMAEAFALEKTSWNDNKIPVVLCYRGTRWLRYGIEVSRYSQHPDEDEFIFSSDIKMKIDPQEISGFDIDTEEQLNEIVYINLYD